MIIVSTGSAAHNAERLAAIAEFVQTDIRYVDHVGIIGIDGDGTEIPGTAGEAGVGIHAGPGAAAIVATVDARLIIWRLNSGVNPIAVRALRDCHTNTADMPRKAAAYDLPPRRATIGRAIQTATRSAKRCVGAPRGTVRLPHRGK